MVTCGRVPKHWRASWTVWFRVRVRHWKCWFGTNDPAKAVAAARGDYENLVMGPGERPVMPKGRCHRNTP